MCLLKVFKKDGSECSTEYEIQEWFAEENSTTYRCVGAGRTP